MATDPCTQTNYSCLPSTPYRTTVASSGQTQITQSKNRDYTMTVGEQSITLQSLRREFQIEYHGAWTWSGRAVFTGGDAIPTLCGTRNGSEGATISENITMLDTQLIYLDHINGIMFWREVTETCQFNHTAERQALFRAPYGSFYSHWFEVVPRRTAVEKFKLLINGSVETVETTSSSSEDGIINVLFPLPPSNVGPTGNAADSPEVFYDYYIDEELQMLDGGQDWYYPSWMRKMGINRAEDIQDATDRYAWWVGSKQPLASPEVIPLPSLGTAYPYGNVAIDAAGNKLVSFTTNTLNINRLYKTDGSVLTLETPDTKLFPVGIV